MSDPHKEYIDQQARTALYTNQPTHSDPAVRQRMGEMLGGSMVLPPEPAPAPTEGDGFAFLALLFGWPLLIPPYTVFTSVSQGDLSSVGAWVAAAAMLAAEVAVILLFARITPWWLFGAAGAVWGGGMLHFISTDLGATQNWVIGLTIVGAIFGLLWFLKRASSLN
jgi:hypothetical protein